MSINRYFVDLSLNKKFMILRLSFLVTLVAVLLILFKTFDDLSNSQRAMENLMDLRSSLYNVRVSLNAQRGEVLINAIANDQLQQTTMNESRRSYYDQKNTLDTLVIYLDTRIKETENETLARSYQELVASMGPLTGLMDEKMKIFGQAQGISDDSAKQEAVNKFIMNYDPLFLDFRKSIKQILAQTEQATQLAKQEYQDIKSQTTVVLIVFFFVAGAAMYILSLYIGRSILQPIMLTKDTLAKISDGKLPEIASQTSRDETGQMLGSLHHLVENLNHLRRFTSEVGRGEFETQTQVFKNQGDIAQSLLLMRESLKAASQKEFQDKWTTTGLSQIGSIIRRDHKDEKALYDEILKFFVKYLDANQGTFFIAYENNRETYLQMVSCFAYERKKVREARVNIGEGIVGQVYLERELTYITHLPKDYIKITSGLGEATPDALVVIPLIHNDTVQGVIEVASFHTFEEYQLNFMKQFGALIAGEIVNARMNAETKILLERSQQQTEELKAQEEELRQNIEELTSTQEEVARRNAEVEGAMKAIRESGILSAEFDLNGLITSADENFLSVFGYTLAEVRGKSHSILVKGDERLMALDHELWRGLNNGSSHSGL